MAHTFSRLLYHFVFSTRNRRPDLREDLRRELLPYLYGVVENAGAHLLKGGAAEDHVHLLIAAKPTHAPAELARVAKANSSRWIGGTWLDLHGFAWQGGYGAFSVSESSADKVAAYIEEQEQHHRRVGFAEELRALLERHGVAYDPQHYLE